MSGESLLKKNIFNVILLAICGSIIYGLPYFRFYYYDAYLETYKLSTTQVGILGSAFGVLGVASYLIGGVLADTIRPKFLLCFSLFATGLLGFCHLIFYNFYGLVAIYALWGVTSLLTFWPSLIKIIGTLGNDDEKSRSFGLFEGGRGLTNMVHSAIAASIFAYFSYKALPGMGLKMIITFYSSLLIVCSIAFYFLLNSNVGMQDEGDKFSFKNLISLFKMPCIYLVIVITFCTYSFNVYFLHITPYATNVLGFSAVMGAVMAIAAQYIRPLASMGGGFLADKVGKAHILLIGFILMIICCLLILAVPFLAKNLQVVIMFGVCAFLYLALYSNWGIYFSLLNEGKVPTRIMGLAIGLVSTIGYLPEVFAPSLAGVILDYFGKDNYQGYAIYFSYLIFVAFVGMIACIIWIKTYGKKWKLEKSKLKA